MIVIYIFGIGLLAVMWAYLIWVLVIQTVKLLRDRPPPPECDPYELEARTRRANRGRERAGYVPWGHKRIGIDK